MPMIDIRESLPDDWPGLETLYPDAFPEEELQPLVAALLAEVPRPLSLVAVADGQLAGHVMFSPGRIEGCGGTAALLGPLAVATAWQRQGIGSALISAGFDRLRRDGVGWVCVLGDPAYYGRHGFAAELEIKPPYPMPDEWQGAWQSLALAGDAPPLPGKLALPAPWMRPELWAP